MLRVLISGEEVLAYARGVMVSGMATGAYSILSVNLHVLLKGSVVSAVTNTKREQHHVKNTSCITYKAHKTLKICG